VELRRGQQNTAQREDQARAAVGTPRPGDRWPSPGPPVHLGAQHLLQRALEEEVQEFLGQGYYCHGEMRRGWRNGYEPKWVKTPMGVLSMAVPQVRATAEPFSSRVATALRSCSEALKRLVLEIRRASGVTKGHIVAPVFPVHTGSPATKCLVLALTLP